MATHDTKILDECRELVALPTLASDASADFIRIILCCLPVPELSIVDNPFIVMDRVGKLLSPEPPEDVFGGSVSSQERRELRLAFDKALTLRKNDDPTPATVIWQEFKCAKKAMFRVFGSTAAIAYVRGLPKPPPEEPKSGEFP